MTPWEDALGRLESLGYQVTLKDGEVRLCYKGESDPPDDKTAPLLGILKAHTQEILTSARTQDEGTLMSLINQTFEEINRAWDTGVLAWAKGRTGFWQKMISLEERISEAALNREIPALKQTLEEYRTLMEGMIEEFKNVGRQESLFSRVGKT